MSESLQNHVVAAIATATGAAGVCIVRIAGTGALQLGDCLAPGCVPRPSERAGNTFCYAKVRHPDDGESVDDVVLLVYRAPHSYTGEDTIELQGHGGAVQARRLLSAALAAGARLAQPGEFTKRAFLNQRMDLTQAEAVCDLIMARSERAARMAQEQLDGRLGKVVATHYDTLMDICSDVEHLLDFNEYEAPDGFQGRLMLRLSTLSTELEKIIATEHEGHLLRDGALVVISGAPNAGKSTLLNCLLGRDRAIVHDQPGTTRDVLEESFILEGVALRLVDTAGLRSGGDAVEREGVARAHKLRERADLNLWVVDSSQRDARSLKDESRAVHPRNTLLVLSKVDLAVSGHGPLPEDYEVVRVSALTGKGIDDLKAGMSRMLENIHGGGCGEIAVSARHAQELREARERLEEALQCLPVDLVVTAASLRRAAEALGRVTGRVYSDDLLERIFSRFCVGK